MIGLTFLAQVAILARGGWLEGQLLLAGVLLAVVLQCLWAMRRLLNAHFDMVLLMLGWGGLGMMVPAVLLDLPPCHTSALSMWTGMLALSAWPSYRYARCLRAAHHEGRLALTLTFDLAGMAAGMALPLPMTTPFVHHSAMLLGMTLGMGLSMAALRWVLRPQVPANS